MKTQNGYTSVELVIAMFWLLVVPAGVFGWVWNIVKIIHTCCAVIDGMLIVRVIGIFVAPLGAIIGYF